MAHVNELVQAGERVRDLKTRERRKDGSLVDVSVSIFPITDDDGRVVRIASIVRDVSERTRGERELREAHARFESAFEHAPIGMAIMSLEGAWLSVNRALCDLLGRTREELLATDFRSVTHPADLAADLELLQRTLRGEIDRYELEKRYLRPDGRIVWGFLARSLVFDDDGQPVHFAVARRLELAPGVLREVEHVAVLHDIGKVGIPRRGAPEAGPPDRGRVGAHATAPRDRRADRRRHRDAGPSRAGGPRRARALGRPRIPRRPG